MRDVILKYSSESELVCLVNNKAIKFSLFQSIICRLVNGQPARQKRILGGLLENKILRHWVCRWGGGGHIDGMGEIDPLLERGRGEKCVKGTPLFWGGSCLHLYPLDGGRGGRLTGNVRGCFWSLTPPPSPPSKSCWDKSSFVLK